MKILVSVVSFCQPSEKSPRHTDCHTDYTYFREKQTPENSQTINIPQISNVMLLLVTIRTDYLSCVEIC